MKRNGWYNTVRNYSEYNVQCTTVRCRTLGKDMVRNGMVDKVRMDIVWEERCNTVGQIQYVKVQCGTVLTVRSSKVL